METNLKTTTPSVSDIFNSMEYGPATESDKVKKEGTALIQPYSDRVYHRVF